MLQSTNKCGKLFYCGRLTLHFFKLSSPYPPIKGKIRGPKITYFVRSTLAKKLLCAYQKVFYLVLRISLILTNRPWWSSGLSHLQYSNTVDTRLKSRFGMYMVFNGPAIYANGQRYDPCRDVSYIDKQEKVVSGSFCFTLNKCSDIPCFCASYIDSQMQFIYALSAKTSYMKGLMESHF